MEGTPFGVVLRHCMWIDPQERMTMQQAARLLNGDDAELLRGMAALPLSADSDTSHGLLGPIDHGDDLCVARSFFTSARLPKSHLVREQRK